MRSAEAPTRPLTAAAFRLTSIDLYITSACNRLCSFCFLSTDLLRSRQMMSTDMARGIVEWATAGDVEEITILGGEPALHPEFGGIVRMAHDLDRSVRTVTNGSAHFRRALGGDRGLTEMLSRVAVSIDSPDARVVDRLRGRGAFADAMATVEALSTSGVPFDINCTVLRSCVDSFPDMLAFAEGLGADRLNVHWFSMVGRAATHARDEVVSAVEWRDRVVGVVNGYRSPRDNYNVDCELAYAFGALGESPSYCAVRGRENLQFLPSGAVFSCGLLVENEPLSGYQWRSDALYRRTGRTEVTETDGCSTCPYRQADGAYKPVCIYNRLVT
jgi:MoaA/NifB/PqqE/SkfB family radical SAM enzyme